MLEGGDVGVAAHRPPAHRAATFGGCFTLDAQRRILQVCKRPCQIGRRDPTEVIDMRFGKLWILLKACIAPWTGLLRRLALLVLRSSTSSHLPAARGLSWRFFATSIARSCARGCGRCRRKLSTASIALPFGGRGCLAAGAGSSLTRRTGRSWRSRCLAQ